MLVWSKEYRPDSGGAGEYRGGLGQIMEIESGIDEPFDLLGSLRPRRLPGARPRRRRRRRGWASCR